MGLHVQLGLFFAIFTAVSTVDVQEYIPQLASKNVAYNVSLNTFILDQPNCTFNQYPTTNVYLVVAKSDAVPQIDEANLGNLTGYDSSIKNNIPYYHTLPMPAGLYPCTDKFINFLLVGSQTSCSENQFCNAPLNNNQTYRVKFVLLSSTGLFQQTQWSKEIVLLKQKKIQEETVGRSGGMITLTTILSVLLAILFLTLLIALPIGSEDICWQRTMPYDSDAYANIDHLSVGTYRSLVFNSVRGKRLFTEDM